MTHPTNNSDSTWVDEFEVEFLHGVPVKLPAQAKQKILQMVNEAEGRGRVSVLSAVKEWADGTEVTYNKFIENELEKIAQLKSLEKEGV